jgi:hypothetical protein
MNLRNRRRRRAFACGAGALVLAGSTVLYARTRQPPDFGTTVVTHDGAKNAQARERFITAYGAGKPGRWQQVVYTVEGDPVFYRLSYAGRGTLLRLVIDTRQDHFGRHDVLAYDCARLTEEGGHLQLLRCSRPQEGTRDLTLP